MARSPSTGGRGRFKEGPHCLFISPFEFYYLVPSLRGAPQLVLRFLPSYARDTKKKGGGGGATKKDRPTDHARVIPRNQRRVNSNTIMDNLDVFALYCASIVSIPSTLLFPAFVRLT